MTEKKTRHKPTLPFSIVLPIIIGLSAFILLFTMINNGTITNELVRRYLAGHAVSKVTTALFLVGLVSLLLVAWDVFRQRSWLSSITLKERKTKQQRLIEGNTPSTPPTTEQLQKRLEKCGEHSQRTYLWRRLFTALDFVHRNGSADGLDEELKYAAETDQEEKQDRYSFARIMIWAIPMLGFLGTVLGISEALGGIEISEDNDFQAMMGGLRSSLYVAFDTTAIALTFAIVLMFLLFAVDRSENTLLTQVDERTREELSRHWDITNQSKDTYVQTVEAIGVSMLESTENLVDRQIKLWRTNIEAAESAWVESVRSAQQAVQTNLQEAMALATDCLTDNLNESIQRNDDAIGRRWEQWQVSLSENARLLVAHQEQLVEHSRTMTDAIDNVGSLAETKQMLVDYLSNIPDTGDYAEASQQLAMAVRLLEFRLSQMDEAATAVDKPDSQEKLKRAA